MKENPTNTTKERRNFRRVNARFPIRYQIKRGGFFATGLTQDVSISGTKLNADRFFPSGIKLKLELNILSKVIKPIGRVVWSQALPHSDRYQMGIAFIEVDPLEKNYLSDYINMKTAEFAELER
ncbi:MAG: PilZ domain-containing protein [Candidatus Omnitrophota bacterium]